MDVVVTTVAVIPSIHLSIGAALASAAMNMAMLCGFSIITWFAWSGEPEADHEAPEDRGHQEVLVPLFMQDAGYKQTINLGVIGPPGSGKSSLINALRGLIPRDPDAAPVGIQATTQEPAPYALHQSTGGDEGIANSSFPSSRSSSFGDMRGGALELDVFDTASRGHPNSVGSCVPLTPRAATAVRLWDLPGIGLRGQKREAYIQELGLPYFDVVLIVFSSRITGVELEMAHLLEDVCKVPHLMVRSQVDLDVESEALDHGRAEDEVLLQLKAEALAEGLNSVFLVSARHPEKYELSQLAASIFGMVKARQRAHCETECPICYEPFGKDEDHIRCTCHWCGNAVCGRCAHELRGRQGEAPCPFCRRWTPLQRPPL